MVEKIPRWYQQAIIYELHIRAFFDSNDDGNGDFRGLVQKLDYLQDIGVTAIWLLPFYPSPLKDDGYDIANYTDVHKNYGTLADFKLFLREAHRRNLRVITELVLNHTSDQHPWFQRARHAKPGSSWRDFYVWSDTADKYAEARIIFKDFETSNWTWDPVAKAYYWHRFYSHQPDLNYNNPAVQKAAFNIIDFWLEMGVDGLRLDAVPYLFEREGTNCENLPETHQFLKKLRRYVDEKYPDRMLLAEANQWPEDAIAYFGEGDECQMAFHFPLMPRMFMSLQMEDRYPLIDIIQQTPPIPPTCQWSIFLRNHDELTLEMVTDEERDYMYRVYAQDPQARINLGIRRRLAPLLNNNRKKIELMNGLLFSFPGTPVIYYGDEIGMGDNYYLGDRNAVRTPMQWSTDRNAGFSLTHPHRLFLPINIDPEYHFESINVSTQQNNPESLLWWMKKLIAIRKRHRALSLGSLHFLYPENSKILAYITQYGDEKILVVANLSRHAEYVELDLSEWKGLHLIELSSQNSFPVITEKPYFITLGAYSFYWFLLGAPTPEALKLARKEKSIPMVKISGDWDDIMKKSEIAMLESILPEYLYSKRWFRQKSIATRTAEIIEIVPINSFSLKSYLLLVATHSIKEESEIYFLPITFVTDEQAAILQDDYPIAFIAELPTQRGYLIDACYDSGFTRSIIQAMARNQKFRGQHGVVSTQRSHQFQAFYDDKAIESPQPLKVEQSNTSILLDQKLILKFYRSCQTGMNPDLEISRFLTEKAGFKHTPNLAGFIEYHDKKNNGISIGLLQQYCLHESDAWQYALKTINQFFENILTGQYGQTIDELILPTLAHQFGRDNIPNEVQMMLGAFGDSMHLLGQRTAELHIALASDRFDPDFAPEPFTSLYQRNIYQSIRGFLGRTLRSLGQSLPSFSESIQKECEPVLESASAIEACIHQVLERKFTGARIRVHGDYHLGQVLYTGKDFIIVDFEGEPARPISERRIKRPPLRDVAGMIRSFDYAAQTALIGDTSIIRPEDLKILQPWGTFWRRWVCVYFLQGYFAKISGKNLLPDNVADTNTLLQIFLVEKAIYEIYYELNNRPDWLAIPCRGLLELLTINQT